MHPTANPTSPQVLTTRQVLAATILALAFLNLLIRPCIDRIEDSVWYLLLAGLLAGIFVGQLNLISVWAALSPGNFWIRLPWAGLLLVLAWFSCATGDTNSGQGEDELLGTCLILGFVVTQIPLWVAKRIWGWQLVGPIQQKASKPQISSLMIGTAFLALALMLVRLRLDGEVLIPNVSMLVGFVGILTIVAIFNLVTVLPYIWLAFWVRPTVPRIIWATLAAGFVGLAEYGALGYYSLGPQSDALFWGLTFSSFQIGQTMVVFVVLHCLKQLGFRVTRENPDGCLADEAINCSEPTLASSEAPGEAPNQLSCLPEMNE